MNVLFIGDVVGKAGSEYIAEVLPEFVSRLQPDLVIANGENAVHGRGLNRQAAEALYDAGVEILTLGNHAWDQKDLLTFIDDDRRIVRPANFPDGTPGRGYTICKVNGQDVMIVNLMGRTFLGQLDCPFRKIDEILRENASVKFVIVDMHAEATSEKLALAWYLNGRVSAVLGTHTHVQTADNRILPKGTAYITDVGMVGPRDGVLGMGRENVIRRFVTQLPARFEVATGERQFCAVFFQLDDTGKAVSIEKLYRDES